MGLFKISASGSARAVHAAAPSPAPAARSTSTTRTVLKTTGRGGAAPRPAPQEDRLREEFLSLAAANLPPLASRGLEALAGVAPGGGFESWFALSPVGYLSAS